MDLVVIAGTRTSLNCSAASDSDLVISWTKDGNDISPPDPMESKNGLYRHNFVFTNPVYSDSGRYECKVESSFLGETLPSSVNFNVFGMFSNF